MPIDTRTPLAITAVDVRKIGTEYKPGRWCHVAAHSAIAERLASYDSLDETSANCLAHWDFLIDRLAELQNTETSLFRKILAAFNHAFGAEVSVKPFARNILNRSGRASGSVLSSDERLEVVAQVAARMREVKAAYPFVFGCPEELTAAIVNNIGRAYKPGKTAGWGFLVPITLIIR